MISILIPVYNQDVTDLVSSLNNQAAYLDMECEILVMEDGSEQRFLQANGRLATAGQVRYFVEPVNTGRAVTRNKLAERASFPWLLFIDADAAVRDAGFLERYLSHCTGYKAVCGGTSYQEARPSDPSLHLRWCYGRRVEQKTAAQRSVRPYASFSGFNFMISKELFMAVRFDENIRQYGHEDTLFGYRLKKQGAELLHIDNPLEHTGLETSRDYLDKTEVAVTGLAQIYRQLDDDRGFAEEVRLISAALKVKRSGLAWLLHAMSGIAVPLIRRQLGSAKPLMFLFQWYKLLVFLHASGPGKEISVPG